MIAVRLIGRIGNQLFIYALAEALRQKRGRNEKIVFYDQQIVDAQWKNSLLDYNIPNVEYRHDYSELDRSTRLQRRIVEYFYKKFDLTQEARQKRYKYEKLFQPILNMLGVVSCVNGYVKVHTPFVSHVYMNGYFQSEKYFMGYENLIKETFSCKLPILQQKDYVRQLMTRNSVCISIKVEHNVGHPAFDVCDKSYYTRAIDYIIQHVKNPLFFICSDNVPYVLEHFIDAKKYDYVCQEKGLAVSDSLAIMGTCKHFIIGNTSFGWWAQYLSNSSDKIVIAPNHWYRKEEMNEICGIYQEHWHLIDVSDYINQPRDNE